MLVLVVVGVDVDDHHVVEVALDRLLVGVAQKLGGVQLIDGDASAAISNQFHGVSPRDSNLILGGARAQRPVQLCHMPSSKTARLAAFRSALVVVMISVGLTR